MDQNQKVISLDEWIQSLLDQTRKVQMEESMPRIPSYDPSTEQIERAFGNVSYKPGWQNRRRSANVEDKRPKAGQMLGQTDDEIIADIMDELFKPTNFDPDAESQIPAFAQNLGPEGFEKKAMQRMMERPEFWQITNVSSDIPGKIMEVVRALEEENLLRE